MKILLSLHHRYPVVIVMVIMYMVSCFHVLSNPMTYYLEIEDCNDVKQRIEIESGMKLTHQIIDTEEVALVINVSDEEIQVPVKNIKKIKHIYTENETSSISLPFVSETTVKFTGGNILIENHDINPIRISIIDIKGNILYKATIFDEDYKINLSEFQKEILIITINDQSYKFISK